MIRRWLGIAQGKVVRWLVRAIMRIRVRVSRLGDWFLRKYLGAPTEVQVHDIASGKPMPLGRIPVRSTKADAKRAAHEAARRLSGDPDISWKKGRKLLNKALREARASGELVVEAKPIHGLVAPAGSFDA